MRNVWLVLALLLPTVAGAAEQAPPPPQRSFLTLQVRGTPKSLNDSIRSVLLEHDPPNKWDLLIIGSKGKGQFTCEVRSNDANMLFMLHRTITESYEVSVNCANGLTSSRGGVMIDLDDPKGGSFVIGTVREKQ